LFHIHDEESPLCSNYVFRAVEGALP